MLSPQILPGFLPPQSHKCQASRGKNVQVTHMWLPEDDNSLVWVLLETSSLRLAQQHSCQLHEAAVRGSPACPLRCQLGGSRFSSADYLWLGIDFLATKNLICFQILHPLPTCHLSCCAPPLPPLPSVSSRSPLQSHHSPCSARWQAPPTPPSEQSSCHLCQVGADVELSVPWAEVQGSLSSSIDLQGEEYLSKDPRN